MKETVRSEQLNGHCAESLSVAVCQLTSVDDVGGNVDQMRQILSSLEGDAPDLICFPENSLYLRLQDDQLIPPIDLDGIELKVLSEWATRHGSVIHIGSVPILRDGRLYNSTLLLRPDSSIQEVYRKIHLFDVEVEGHKPVRESDVFTHGQAPSVFDVNGWKFGSTICYDLRFGELFAHYAKEEVDVLLIPSAFLVPTGEAHWEILTRARAIECQAYVLAAAQGGVHNGSGGGRRVTYGHSMIIDPWGLVLQSLPQECRENRILRAVLSRDRIRRVRAQIPMKSHRRLL